MTRRICFLLPSLGGGGVERNSLSLAQEFLDHDIVSEFAVLNSEGSLIDETRQNFAVTNLNCKRIREAPRAVAAFIKENEFDWIQASVWPLTTAASAAKMMSGSQSHLMLCEHNPLSIQYADRGLLHRTAMRASMGYAYRVADSVVGVSSDVADDISKLASFPRRLVTVINNPIAPRPAANAQQTGAANALWNTPRNDTVATSVPKRILTVGSLKPQKNYALLIEALGLMRDKSVKLMILGEGGLLDSLKQQAQAMGVADRVLFPGFHSDPTAFYETSDVFALSSNYEGFGNVLVEALAAGKPIVSTDCPGGPHDILADGIYGALVPVGDAGAMAKALDLALDEAGNPEIQKNRAKDFDVTKIAQQYITCFEKGWRGNT